MTATNQDDNQRDADHGEDREGVLARPARSEADRHETRDGDQRAGQHRRRQRAIGEGCGRLLAVKAASRRDHGVDRGHGVVDEQGERDDQGAERDALEVRGGRIP